MLRSLLFVPGNKASMLEKALGLKPDAFAPDMEDSVPAAEKANARETIAAFLPRLAATGVPVIPRVNSLDTEWIEADLEAVVGPHVYGISVGKVRRAGDIAAISRLIGKLETRAGLPFGTLHLVPWIETAEAIVNVAEICRASERIGRYAERLLEHVRFVAGYEQRATKNHGSSRLRVVLLVLLPRRQHAARSRQRRV